MKYLIANFKSHKTLHEYEEWLDRFEQHSAIVKETTQIILAPAFPSLLAFSSRLVDDKLHPRTSLGVQDISPFPAGKYTGGVSTINLEGFSAKYAIVGHSERRKYFHETNQDIANKVNQCIVNDIVPIVCVTSQEIEAQANVIDADQRTQIMVAFEPVEHIGTGEADSLERILEIKQRIRAAFGEVKYIYGGSVDPNSETKLLQSPDIDGFLVGTACLNPETFIQLTNLV